MKSRSLSPIVLAAAAGAAMSLPVTAHAQSVVNISGATLLENFVKSQASTNDYIDVDGDGQAGHLLSAFPDQLAPFGLPPDPLAQHWIIQYRVVGSINGFNTLIDFGRTFVETVDGVDLKSATCDAAYHNRNKFIVAGAKATEIFNAGNPGALPVRSTMDGTYTATYSTPDNPSPGGIQIDVAPLDVPARWAVFYGTGDALDPGAGPGDALYGRNARRSVNKQGLPDGADLPNLLSDLKDLNIFDPAQPETADENTVFDTSLFFAPITPVVSLGVGLREITMTNVRYYTTTGRLATGENLMAVVRDVGSGTRNAFMNSIGIDPSFGVGESIGPLSVSSDKNLLGPNFIPGNKGANGAIENTMINSRLGIGYVGAERGATQAWLTGGKFEILAVRNDIYGGTEFSRANIDEVLDNGPNGFVIGGPATLATIGNPRSAPPELGGYGWSAGDEGIDTPAPRNLEAAAYVNNITRSIEEFITVPGGDESVFMPGEYAATQFILTPATDFVQDSLEPTHQVVNPKFNQALQDFTRTNSVLKNPAYYSFGAAGLNGLVPARLTGVTYSDGVTGSQNFYIVQSGSSLTYGSALNDRNRISGDFNGDAKRDMNDAAEMVKAWKQRAGLGTWTAPDGTGDIAGATGDGASIEILGDFNGDGNFDGADIRYWADGLGVDPATRKINRKSAFKAVDDAFGGNFFGTTLSGGGSYTSGDSRADVSGPGKSTTRGFAPVGADGVIDSADIDYVKAQFTGNPFVTDGEANWDDLSEAIGFDLSADVNGDLKVNAADVAEIEAMLGSSGCYADCNQDTRATVNDFICFQAKWKAKDAYGDFDGSGTYTINDFIKFQSEWKQFQAGNCVR